MNNCSTNHLYLMSFVVGSDSGLALVSAPTARQADQLLRNGGKYNGSPSSYTILQTRDIGLASTLRTEVLMESYVNALVAFDAIMSVANKYIGPQGYEGKSAYDVALEHGYSGSEEEWIASLKGEKGNTGDPAGFGELKANIIDPMAVGTPGVTLNSDGPDTAKNMEFVFRNLRGQVGPQGEVGPMVPTVNALDSEDNQISANALSAAQGPVIKTMFDQMSARVDGAVFVGQTVESWSDDEPNE